MDIPAGAPFKEKFHAEVKKLREMSFKEKMEYIWEYYKLPLIGVIVFLGVAASFINTIFINPPPGSALFVAWSAGYATDEQFSGLKNALEEHIVDGKENEEVVISMFFLSDVDPTMSSANIQRLAAMMAEGEIDVFVLDPILLEEYANIGYLLPMEELLSETRRKNPEIYTRIAENITYTLYKSSENKTEERIFGVSIGNSPLFSELGFYEQELYFCVAISTRKTENIKTALIALFE